MAYQNPRGLMSAVQEHARAREVPNALEEFFAQRLIARLAVAFPDRWALKGGHAMVARLPEVARVTKDVDCALVATSREEAVAELELAARLEPADRDFLEFELVKVRSGHVEDLAFLSFRVRLGGKVHGTVSLDAVVVRDRRLLGELVPLGRRVDPPKQGGWPEQVRVTPVADHMAEKLVALYSVHRGRPSSRERDIIDLALLARYAPPAEGTLAPALGRALERPTPPSVSVELPEQFVVPERFRPAFEREHHGLSWEASMEEVSAVTAPALNEYGGVHRSRTSGGEVPAPRPLRAEGSISEEAGEASTGEVYVRPHTRGGHHVPGHWRSGPGTRPTE